MNHLKIIILCLSLGSVTGAEGFRAVGPFATSDQAILNQDTLQTGASFYVHHGSATVMDAGLFRGDGSGLTDISTSAFADVWVNESGDVMTGQLTIDGSTLTVGGPAFSVGGSTFIVLNGNVGISSATPGELFAVGDSLLTVKDCGSVHIGLISTCAFMLNVGTETFTGSQGRAYSPPRLAFDNVFDNAGLPSVNKFVFYNLNNSWVGGLGMSTNNMNWFVGPNGNFRFHTGTTNIDGTGASEKVSILANGNVGIGDTAPSALFSVVTTNAGPVSLSVVHGTSNLNNILSVSRGAEVPFALMTTVGDVGLGYSAPTHRLAVNGDAYFASSVTVGGGIYVDDVNAINLVASTITALNESGLRLEDDSNTLAIFIEDGGQVGFSTPTPNSMLHLNESGAIPTTPTLSFGVLGNDGIYSIGSNNLQIALNGVRTWVLNNTYMGSDEIHRPRLRNTDASVTTPNINPRGNDTDTGLGSRMLDQLSLIANGVNIVNISTEGVGIGLTDPSSKFEVRDGTVTISTSATGGFDGGIRFQDSSYQNTAHNPIAISSEPAHSPDIASLTYVGVATVTFTVDYTQLIQCSFAFSGNNGSGAARTYTVALVIDGVFDADHAHAVKNSGNGDSLHIDLHFDILAPGSHTCAVWALSTSVTGAQVADNAHVDVLRF